MTGFIANRGPVEQGQRRLNDRLIIGVLSGLKWVYINTTRVRGYDLKQVQYCSEKVHYCSAPEPKGDNFQVKGQILRKIAD